MADLWFIDTETCGLHGLPVLFQYAIGDGPIILHEIWKSPMSETLSLFDRMCQSYVVGFNLAFDWFHINKLYTIFTLWARKGGSLAAIPEEHINELGVLEEEARFLDLCIKPLAACDLMLLARKTHFQSLMPRDDIKIRRVPRQLAQPLCDELEKRVEFDQIYFAGSKSKTGIRWKIYDIQKDDGTWNTDFKDIKLRFKPKAGLKQLSRYILKIKDEDIIDYRQIEPDWYPEEKGFAPFAKAVAPNYVLGGNWLGSWPEGIHRHIFHWGYMPRGREYASDDIDYTRRLYYASPFNAPTPGDDDSTLAIAVACCRWHGFAVNIEKLNLLKANALKRISAVPIGGKRCKSFIFDCLSETERICCHNSTKKTVLEELSTWTMTCPQCNGNTIAPESNETCPNCKGTGEVSHPVAQRSKEILIARKAKKEIELYDKLLLAKRFHASFVVIGTLSTRMSGSDSLNPQGINHTKDVRSAFTLADANMLLCGGDFKSFEVSIAAAVFDDPDLNAALKTGFKVHGLLGMELFPGTTYEDILKSEATDNDMYDKGKKGFFLLCYGGNANTFLNKLGIPLEIGEAAYQRFCNKYKRVGLFSKITEDEFGALVQRGGIGSKIDWRDPKDFVESFLGFRRYFTLENKVIRTLFDLAQKPPTSWHQFKIKVTRRAERVQTACGAVQSALYGAAFGLCSANVRAAKNHKIQSPGAQITKYTQRRIWDLQPVGASDFKVMPLNCHDEIMCPTKMEYVDSVKSVATSCVDNFRSKIPLLAIDWFSNIPNWGNKKGP